MFVEAFASFLNSIPALFPFLNASDAVFPDRRTALAAIPFGIYLKRAGYGVGGEKSKKKN